MTGRDCHLQLKMSWRRMQTPLLMPSDARERAVVVCHSLRQMDDIFVRLPCTTLVLSSTTIRRLPAQADRDVVHRFSRPVEQSAVQSLMEALCVTRNG